MHHLCVAHKSSTKRTFNGSYRLGGGIGIRADLSRRFARCTPPVPARRFQRSMSSSSSSTSYKPSFSVALIIFVKPSAWPRIKAFRFFTLLNPDEVVVAALQAGIGAANAGACCFRTSLSSRLALRSCDAVYRSLALFTDRSSSARQSGAGSAQMGR